MTFSYLRWFLRNKVTDKFFWNLPWLFSTRKLKKKKKNNKEVARLRDVMEKSYPIYAYTRANHARYSSVHILR